MNEHEWLTCEDPDRMRKFLGKKYSPRKLRLFAVACCRLVWDLLGQDSRHSVEVAERFAEGQANEYELDEAGDAVFSELTETAYRIGESGHNPAAWVSLRKAYKAAVDVSAYAAGWGVGPTGTLFEWDNRMKAARARHCSLLRDIVGNPFHPIDVPPGVLAWQNGTVVRMAQAIYDDRRFGDLPVLADALEEAGCDNADILIHCRDEQEHVRGCWVLDLILAKG